MPELPDDSPRPLPTTPVPILLWRPWALPDERFPVLRRLAPDQAQQVCQHCERLIRAELHPAIRTFRVMLAVLAVLTLVDLVLGAIALRILGTCALLPFAVLALMGWVIRLNYQERLDQCVRRAAAGDSEPLPRCAACGYDLRGNPRATACPECGAARQVRAAE